MKIQTNTLSIMARLIVSAIVIQIGLFFHGYCSAAEVETRIQGIDRDVSAARDYVPGSKFVLVPIPVSNPTVGVGLTLAGIYLHRREQAEEGGPTTTTGLGVMYTSNESWLVGAFHDGYYFNGFMRLNVAAGYGELHLKYYGTGNDSIFQENPLEFKATSARLPLAGQEVSGCGTMSAESKNSTSESISHMRKIRWRSISRLGTG